MKTGEMEKTIINEGWESRSEEVGEVMRNEGMKSRGSDKK